MPLPPIKCLVISLIDATARRQFQRAQAKRYNLNMQFVDAVDVATVERDYLHTINHWHRPMWLKESACFLSHKKAWQIASKENGPVLILEDDSVLADNIHQALCALEAKTWHWRDIIDIEWVPRKHSIAKKNTWSDDVSGTTLKRLFINKNGAGGYIIYPKGALKLLDNAKHITLLDAYLWHQDWSKNYQVEPALSIQLLFLDKDKTFTATKPVGGESTQTIATRPFIQNLAHRLRFELSKIPAYLKSLLYGSKRDLIKDVHRFHWDGSPK